MSNHFEYASYATIGGRNYQEDTSNFAPLPQQDNPEHFANIDYQSSHHSSPQVLAVLADGMGGHVGGSTASHLACETFIDTYLSMEGNRRDCLKDALDKSNLSLAQKVREDSSYDGMGCTLVGVHFNSETFHWVSVGDSLLYLFRDKKLIKLNDDHSLTPMLLELVKNGEMTEEEALNHPKRNALRSALTGHELELVDLPEQNIQLEENDWIIVASDGLLTLSEEKISETIESYKDNNALDVAKGLVQSVEEVGLANQDNTTVMAIHYKPVTEDDQTTIIIPNSNKKSSKFMLGSIASIAFVVIVILISTFIYDIGLIDSIYSGNKVSPNNLDVKPIATSKAVDTKPIDASRHTKSVQGPVKLIDNQKRTAEVSDLKDNETLDNAANNNSEQTIDQKIIQSAQTETSYEISTEIQKTEEKSDKDTSESIKDTSIGVPARRSKVLGE